MQNQELDKDFVEQQRQTLKELRSELTRIQEGMEEDKQDRSDEEQDSIQDSGDMSHQMFTREMDATVSDQMDRRLEDIERALAKIDEGTYGVCDDSGERIPKGRLEAVPEAVRTVEAQQRFERERRPT